MFAGILQLLFALLSLLLQTLLSRTQLHHTLVINNLISVLLSLTLKFIIVISKNMIIFFVIVIHIKRWFNFVEGSAEHDVALHWFLLFAWKFLLRFFLFDLDFLWLRS